MKYFTRLKLYKASNVTFNPETLEAYSYGWWRFVEVIDGLVVFNDYRYSPSTAKHQRKISQVMQELGIKIDVMVEVPDGLQSLDSGVSFYKSRIETLNEAIAKKGSKKAKNEERKALIKQCEEMIVTLESLKQAQDKEAA